MISSLVLTRVSPPVHGPGSVPAFQVTFKFNAFFSLTSNSLFLLDIDVTSHTRRHKSLYLDESDRLGYLSLPSPKLLTFFPRGFSRVESQVFNLGGE